jgi:hypothetical protein
MHVYRYPNSRIPNNYESYTMNLTLLQLQLEQFPITENRCVLLSCEMVLKTAEIKILFV